MALKNKFSLSFLSFIYDCAQLCYLCAGCNSQLNELLTLKYIIIPQLCRKTMWQLFHALPQGVFSFQSYMRFTAVGSTTCLNLWVHMNSEWFRVFGVIQKFLNLSVIVLYTTVHFFYRATLFLLYFFLVRQYLCNLFEFHILISHFIFSYEMKIIYKPRIHFLSVCILLAHLSIW
jgi:hypothetical protein